MTTELFASSGKSFCTDIIMHYNRYFVFFFWNVWSLWNAQSLFRLFANAWSLAHSRRFSSVFLHHSQFTPDLQFCIWMDANLNLSALNASECLLNVKVDISFAVGVISHRRRLRCRLPTSSSSSFSSSSSIIMLMWYQIDLLCCWKSNILDYNL